MYELTKRDRRDDAASFRWGNLAEHCWKHLMIRCGSPSCTSRLKAQPAVFAKFNGVHYNNRWYHDSACLKEALIEQLGYMLLQQGPRRNRAHRIPIGLLLVERSAITAAELREALRLQRQAGAEKLGYWLQQITKIDEGQICAALGQQWGCPVFPLDRHFSSPMALSMPPYPLLAAAKAVPAFSTQNGRQLHVAFSERIDHTLLYALGEILQCQTFGCVARESAVRESLEVLHKQASEHDISFDSVHDPREMAATICSYAAQMDVRQLKVVRAAGYIWVAFFQRGARRDLLFREPVAVQQSRKPAVPSMLKAFPALADIRKDGVSDAAELL